MLGEKGKPGRDCPVKRMLPHGTKRCLFGIAFALSVSLIGPVHGAEGHWTDENPSWFTI